MTVAFDAASPSGTSYQNVSSKTYTHTPSGTPDYVRVGVSWAKSGTTTASVTYGGAAMTSVGNATYATGDGSTSNAQMFEKIAPASGAQSVVVTFSAGGNYGYAGSQTYTGVHQTTASGTPVTATGSTTPITATISITSGNMGSDVASSYLPTTLTANRTERYKGNSGLGSAYWGAGQDTATSGSVAMSWTQGLNSTWGTVAAEILAAGVATIVGPLIGGRLLRGGTLMGGRLAK